MLRRITWQILHFIPMQYKSLGYFQRISFSDKFYFLLNFRIMDFTILPVLRTRRCSCRIQKRTTN